MYRKNCKNIDNSSCSSWISDSLDAQFPSLCFFLFFKRALILHCNARYEAMASLIFSRYMASAYRLAAYREFAELSEVAKRASPGAWLGSESMKRAVLVEIHSCICASWIAAVAAFDFCNRTSRHFLVRRRYLKASAFRRAWRSEGVRCFVLWTMIRRWLQRDRPSLFSVLHNDNSGNILREMIKTS